MKHSRAFIVALNSDDDFEWLVEFREIVKELVEPGSLTGDSIDWLNEHSKPFTYRALYYLDGFQLLTDPEPKVELEFDEEDRGCSVAAETVASFLAFLLEMHDTRLSRLGATYPSVARCTVCSDFFVLNRTHIYNPRPRLYCNPRCRARLLRSRAKAAKKAK